MSEVELVLEAEGAELPATLTLSEGARAGIVTMHPAISSDRHYFLLEHLAGALAPRGISVLRYDRRPSEGIDDVPFATQSADALRGIATLRERIGPLPIGVWGYSQGTWGATLAAADAPGEVSFLVLIAAPGVSPAEQMRYGTAEQLRRHGFGREDLAELAELRDQLEGFLRGDVPYDVAQTAIARRADRDWFPLIHLPPEIPADARWHDMDFDPAPAIARVRCPVLLVYGTQDEWTPVESSLDAWRSMAQVTPSVELLDGCGHAPVVDASETIASVDPRYARRLVDWLDEVIGGPPRVDTADRSV
jgi:uncharacterized protein